MVDHFIVGSAVMHAFYINIEPKDLDIFYREGTKKPKIKNDKKVEYHAIPSELFDKFITLTSAIFEETFINLESLYILKLSHAEYDIHWRKTLGHIRLLKWSLCQYYRKKPENLFESLPKEYKELFYALKDYWKIVHKNKKTVKLNRNKDSFFKDKVKRKYDHDLLHEIIKYENEPLYKKCLVDGKEVLLDEKKFKELTYKQKLNLCREEIYVIALERYLIPNNFNLCEHEYYQLALKRLVTQMTTGWFPTFIVDNYDKLCKIDKNYMEIFKKKVKNYV